MGIDITADDIALAELAGLQELIDSGTTLSDEAADALRTELCRYYADAAGGGINALAVMIGAWRKRKQFKTAWSNVPEKLMLAVTELSEAMEAYRHIEMVGEHDEAVPIDATDCNRWFTNFGEEIADTIIRLLDLSDALQLDIEARICEKMAANERRPSKHGKTC